MTFGYRGSDIIGTPGLVWEIKTAAEFKPTGFVAQARKYSNGALPIVIYIPNGVGEGSIEFALGIMPLHQLVALLDDAGYTPKETSQ